MLLEDATRKAIVVNRKHFELDYYFRKEDEIRFSLIKKYPISVGIQGHKTIPGLYVIHTKEKDPDWRIPDEAWATEMGLIPGTIVKGGTPENPLKERWLGVTPPEDGIGIHGTANLDSLGTRGSHGCIRMAPKDVIELYSLIPEGTPIVIL